MCEKLLEGIQRQNTIENLNKNKSFDLYPMERKGVYF